MATIFKTLTADDVTSTRTLLHEAIPLTGSIISGTYEGGTGEENVLNFSHGMFQSVYDYPYLSSSANHIVDITAGYSNSSILSSSANPENAKKINLYNQFAQILVGHDTSGNILEFDADGDIIAGGTKFQEVFFLCFTRLLTKDEIKKGGMLLDFYLEGTVALNDGSNPTNDTGSLTSFKVNSPAGEYGILSMPKSGNVGLVYYQAGIVVLTSSMFPPTTAFGSKASSSANTTAILTGSTIQVFADGVRNRWNDCNFNNTIELNSTIYFCRANHNEFNYSSNPTYLNGSKIRVKNTTTDSPVAYITSVGLMSPDNELLAVAKLSEPLKKTPENELTIRVRIDY